MDSGTNKRALSSIENSPVKSNRSPKKQCLTNGSREDAAGEYDFLFDGDNCFDFIEEYTQSPLNLKDYCRCVVNDIQRERKSYQIILQLGGEDNPSSGAKLRLQGPWCQTRIERGDLVSVQAVWDEGLQCFKVDKDHGFVVTNPDTLISGTSVVGALFCQRKGVLQERFRGIDRNNHVMVIGSLVHEILQTVLAKSLKTREQIENVAKELLESPETAYTLYDCQMSRHQAMLEVQKFTNNILNFVEQYVDGKEPQVLMNGLFQGKIDEITDIEENLWVPQLGLKGKVDVSVKINRNTSRNRLPLELKTGRASFSLEHKGQLILYQMMLTATGRETDSGLLLYLREGMMKEIRGTRNEHRDLIMLRNELSYYLTRSLDAASVRCDTPMKPMELPEPIFHHSACSKCPYATICCSLGKVDPNLTLSESHPLRQITKESLKHLTDEDLKYFVKWCGLLSLEEQVAKKSNFLRSIWKDSPAQRQYHGRAIMNLHIKDIETLPDGRFRHTFELPADREFDIATAEISPAEYVIVSTPHRIAIASGFVYDVTKRTITVNLERNLSLNYSGQSFIVDKHESQSEQVFNYTNLGVLLDNQENINTLRSIVIHRVPPNVGSKLPLEMSSPAGRELFESLNSVQQNAVMAAIRTENFMLIKGLPGTGKTQTLVVLVRLLRMAKKTIIITSHTHSAVDNLLLRLKPYEDLKFIRLGTETRIHPDLVDYSEHNYSRSLATESELEAMYASFDIVAVTCLGAGHPIFTRRRFDYCIVDEATQIMQPTVLRPLFYASKFILVGDPDQLPPLVRSKDARALGASESLFERLDSSEATKVLTVQYRMNKTVMQLANNVTYKKKLMCADHILSKAVLETKKPILGKSWRHIILKTHIDMAVIFVDTLNCLERSNRVANSQKAFLENISQEDRQRSNQALNYTNYCEAGIIFELITFLFTCGVDGSRIGIIAPYRAQVTLLRKLCMALDKSNSGMGFAKVEVNTVDQYQGRDKDVIFYSCTRTGSPEAETQDKLRGVEILEDKRRLTVAITRSKHKLVLVGDGTCLEQYTPFNELMKWIPSMCKVKLNDGKFGFSWDTVLGDLQNTLSLV